MLFRIVAIEELQNNNINYTIKKNVHGCEGVGRVGQFMQRMQLNLRDPKKCLPWLLVTENDSMRKHVSWNINVIFEFGLLQSS